MRPDEEALEHALESLQRHLGATESHVSSWGGVLPLLTAEQRLMAAYGVHLALELIRERRREGDTGALQGGGGQGR